MSGYPSLAELPPPAGPPRRLRICVATPDVAGPVRNGGVGTTYAALAELLAEAGHDCTLLYLKGQTVETGDVQGWIDRFAARGVRFLPVPDAARQANFRTPQEPWLQQAYNLMHWLLLNPMDVVHVSEWEAAGQFALEAKRQGLAFGSTVFVVKASSPLLWIRLEGANPFDRPEFVSRAYAERRSIELADVAVGGSRYLLDWMAGRGYRLPERTFVQPNVFRLNPALLRADRPAPGVRQAVRELVFFGRLESRKGLLEFCQALDRLVEAGGPLPEKVTFLGRAGQPLSRRPGLTIPQFIDAATARWPFPTERLSDLAQPEAVAYLMEPGRLAVMPSLSENSSLALYEAALYGAPCVAADVGGNAELLHPEDADAVLHRPTVPVLAAKLDEVLRLGGVAPRPSFDNAANLAVWRDAHAALAALPAPRPPKPEPAGRISVCIYAEPGFGDLQATLRSLARQIHTPLEVLVSGGAEAQPTWLDAQVAIPLRRIEAAGGEPAETFNALARRARGEALLLLRAGVRLAPEALAGLRRLLSASGAELAAGAHRQGGPAGAAGGEGETTLHLPLLRGPGAAFLEADPTPAPVLVRRRAFDRLGGCGEDLGPLGTETDLLLRAVHAGLACEASPLPLSAAPRPGPVWLEVREDEARAARTRLPAQRMAAAIAQAPELLLLARNRAGPQAPPPRPPAGSRVAADPTDGSVAAAALALFGLPGGRRAVAPPAATAASVRLLAVHEDRLFLRAYDPGDPGAEGVVELEADGAAAPSLARAEAAPGSAVAGSLWTARFAEGPRPRLLRLRRTGPEGEASLLVPPPAAATLASLGVDGYCDPSDDGIIHGWAWRPAAPAEALDVAIFIDGAFFTRVAAVQHRVDLFNEGVGCGDFGFSVRLPDRLDPGRPHRIEAVVADFGVPLNNSPLLAEGRSVRPGRLDTQTGS